MTTNTSPLAPVSSPVSDEDMSSVEAWEHADAAEYAAGRAMEKDAAGEAWGVIVTALREAVEAARVVNEHYVDDDGTVDAAVKALREAAAKLAKLAK